MTAASIPAQALALILRLRIAAGGQSALDAESPRHSLPRREGRPRRQGRELRRPASMPAIRSRAAKAYDAAGADELCFLDITASHEARGILLDVVRAHRRGLLHAAHRRRRRAHGRGYPRAAAGRRRQGVDQHRRGERPGFRRARPPRSSAASASSSPSTPRRCRRAGEPTAGRSSPMAAATPTGLDAVAFAKQVAELGAGEILRHLDGPRRHQGGYDLALTRAIADAVRCRSSPPAASALSTISSTASATAMPARCWPPRSSTSAPIRSREAKGTWRRQG